jgi:hypothetical protein
MKKEIKDKPEEIRIDYENFNVADIMEQIRNMIANRPAKPEPPHPEGIDDSLSPTSASPEMESLRGSKDKARTLLLKIMKPIAPLIKFLVFPVHQELRNTIEILDRTNKNLETLEEKHELALSDLNRAKEYIRILHSLSHNLVVELTKLKIETEHLKIKTRIMEKDLEYLGQKEKILESYK